MATLTRPNIVIPSGLDVVAGIWLIVSPFVVKFPTLPGAMVNNFITGFIVAILAGVSASGTYQKEWPSWLSTLFGLWVIASPWVFGFTEMDPAKWNNVLTGIVICLFAIWSGSAISNSQSSGPS